MIDGSILVGSEDRRSLETFRAHDASTGQTFGTPFCAASKDDISDACALAWAAAQEFARYTPTERAEFLKAIADEILGIGDELIDTAVRETGLPPQRIISERQRTIGQLGMFADELRNGSCFDLTIHPADADRVPARPDIRRINRPLGPVAVFGASNFPLAFSVAGGDTASAFAAGCPVIVKGHPAHPGTGELVARAIRAAVQSLSLPAGVFSYLPGPTPATGQQLVSDHRVKAVGFTGSRTGGLALMRLAEARPVPIPVFAEMSSINPVVVLPAALATKGEALGREFGASLTLGAGQFCTNPGLVIVVRGPGFDAFLGGLTEALSAVTAPTMLTTAICEAFDSGVRRLEENPRATRIAGRGRNDRSASDPAVFLVKQADILEDPSLSEEVFGSSSIIVSCASLAEVHAVIDSLEGQLTATLHCEEPDFADAGTLVDLLSQIAGRVIVNNWPTGVEVSPAMVHGGPYPATSDGRSTSVGTLAMQRFLRPVCYQNIPEGLIPDYLIS